MAKTIPLTRGYEAIVDDSDFEWLSRWKWHASDRPGTNRTVYARRGGSHGGIQYTVFMHRQILGTPEGLETDHVDGDGLNNQRHNLRLATTRENQANRPSRGRSKFLGVHWHKRQCVWAAQIRKDGIRKHLGSFRNEDDAARAYNEAAIERYGPYARLNQVGE